MNSQKTSSIRVGIAGVGTVGTSVVNILHDKFSVYRQQFGVDISVSRVAVRNLTTQRNCDLSAVAIGDDVMELSRAEDVDVVIELIGDVKASLELVRASLLNNKPVITANKALLALHGDELFALSKEKQVPLLFEAAVGGGIPIIKVMRESLVANDISCVAGIINGTCNYLLTRMANEGVQYDSVLADAQQLGYAEADPTFDVEGIDAAHKLTLLARLAFNQSIEFAKIPHYGLSDICTEDFAIAKKMGYIIKPMSIAKRVDNGIETYVFPALVSRSSLLAHVNDVTNVVQISANRVNTVHCVGPGAGGDATASSVIADLLEIVDAINKNSLSSVTMPPLGDEKSQAHMLDFEDTQHAYYLRFEMDDKPGMMKQCASILERFNVSIEVLKQDEPKAGETTVSLALITNVTQEKTLQSAFKEIIDLEGCNSQNASLIRVFNN